MHAARALLASSLAALAVAACNEISGVGRFHVDRPGETACDDGADDEGDQLPDCLDPECTGFICADAAPTGWTGPFVARREPGAVCPDGAAPTAVVGEDPDTAHLACTPCTCGAQPDTTCELPKLSCGADCMTQAVVFTASGTGCSAAPVSGSCRAVAGVADATCAAFGAEPAAAAFGLTWAICASSGAGCEAGTCVAQPGATSKVCVVADGDVPCPAGRYGDRHVVYDVDDTIDSRGCSPSSCTCEVGDAPTCDAEAFQVYDGPSCAGNPIATVLSTCAGPVTGSHVRAQLAVPSGGSCTATGVLDPTPTGALLVPSPRTLCCID